MARVYISKRIIIPYYLETLTRCNSRVDTLTNVRYTTVAVDVRLRWGINKNCINLMCILCTPLPLLGFVTTGPGYFSDLIAVASILPIVAPKYMLMIRYSYVHDLACSALFVVVPLARSHSTPSDVVTIHTQSNG